MPALLLSSVLAAAVLLSGCPHSAPQQAPAGMAQPPGATAPNDTGAVPPAATDTAPGAVAANPASDAAGEPAAPGTEQAPADPSLLPGGGGMQLAGAHLGMSLAEVYGRYPQDSGWSYDARFIATTHTGTVVAKPLDAKARATELFTLQDGRVVSFVRVVKEDATAFAQAEKEFTAKYGAPVLKPPLWAMSFELFRHWHTTANEESRFWADEAKQAVLTAALRASGRETIYMLIDMPRFETTQKALASAPATEPDPAPPADTLPPLPPSAGAGQ
jgi:hypothetical protein